MLTPAEGTLAAAVGWFYLVTNATRIFAYLPQIAAIWRCHDGAFAISLLTWSLWTISHVAALLYGALVMSDLYFVGITTMNLLGCSAITGMAAWRRAGFWREQVKAGSTGKAVSPDDTLPEDARCTPVQVPQEMPGLAK